MTFQPSVLFRTSGSPTVGFGHVRRCLTLAEALRSLGARCAFALDGDPTLKALLAPSFPTILLCARDDISATLEAARAMQAQLIVLDSYQLPSSYGLACLEAGLRVALIDDLGRTDLRADLVTNSSPSARCEDYAALRPAVLLLGPEFALLRPAFASTRPKPVPERIGRVLITMGGSDLHHLTNHVIQWTRETLNEALIDVIVGPLLQDAAGIDVDSEQYGPGVSLLKNPDNIWELMARADLAVSGGGQTVYELAATGTPTVAILCADNQRASIERLHRAGILLWAASASDTDVKGRTQWAMQTLAHDVCLRSNLSRAGRRLVDGRGADRVAQHLMQLLKP